MSITKFFEIRDSMTCLPLMVTKLEPINSDEDWLIKRAMGSEPYPLYHVVYLGRDIAHFDVYEWGQLGARTVKTAHDYIQDHFDELGTGDVIDIQFILQEKAYPKRSENPNKLTSTGK